MIYGLSGAQSRATLRTILGDDAVYENINNPNHKANPAAYIADVTANEAEDIKRKSTEIHQRAKEHLLEFLPVGNTYVHLEELERQQSGAKQG